MIFSGVIQNLNDALNSCTMLINNYTFAVELSAFVHVLELIKDTVGPTNFNFNFHYFNRSALEKHTHLSRLEKY